MNEDYIAKLAQLGISELAINNSFSQATLERGTLSFENKEVTITDIKTSGLSDDDIKITSDVCADEGFSYRTQVDIKKTSQHTSIIGECDCPVGFRCQHAVASLLQFSQEQEIGNANNTHSDSQQNEIDVDNWLNSFDYSSSSIQLQQKSSESVTQTQTVYNSILLYLLHEGEKGLEVITIVARRLKKGGFGKGREQSIEDLIEGYSSHLKFEHNELDIEIAGLLYSMTSNGLFYRSRGYSLKGDVGELTLKKLLATHRLFWQTQELNQPLQWGEQRALKVSWNHIDHYYRPQVITTQQTDKLFRLQSFFYIDIKNNEMGIAQHESLATGQIMTLLNAPDIPEKMAEKVSEQLLQSWPENEIPMPVTLSSEMIKIEQMPIADIKLHSVNISDDNNKHRVHLLSLRFDYGGQIIQPEKKSNTYRLVAQEEQGQQHYHIIRNSIFEQHCLNLLTEHHFSSISRLGISGFSPLDHSIKADSMTASLWHWHDFQYELMPKLQEQGWRIHIDDSFHFQIEEADEWYGDLEEKEDSEWFEISLGIELNGKTINLLPSLVELLSIEKDPAQMRSRILSRDFIILPVSEDENNPRWIKLPSERIMGIFDTLVELYDTHALNNEGNLEFSKYQGLQLGELLNDPKLKWKGADQLKKLTQKIQNFKGIELVQPPENLYAELRDYQQYGLSWLQFTREYQFNGILADDMGLGKTVQALSHLLYEKQQNQQLIEDKRPTLVIAPTSLMGNWRRESERFTPELNVLVLHGSERANHFDSINQYDIILTTYALMLRDKEFHEQQSYHFVILDEAQNIKNARSKTSQVIFKLKSKHRLCMTGTPMENHLGELWSLFHFLMPGYLSTQERFTRLFRSPIEKQGDYDRQQQLYKRVKPFMLRRTKEMVATELPEKTEIIRTVPLSGTQRDLYETVRLAMDEKVREEISKKGLARSQIMILDALLKLRQTCCDPRLLSLTKAKDVKVSAKLEMLMEMVPEMLEEGRKIIIFSQFVKMLGFIEDELNKLNVNYAKLTGQTRNRDEVIMDFQEGDAQVFLISLKAGGVGLNLTAADTVIHYDPWWNPAVERQATDRAYRIGQDKPVFVYKLLTEETVEEKILQMQKNKQKLADALYQDKKNDENPSLEKKSPQFSQEELMDLLNPLES